MTEETLNSLINALQGTCMSLDEACSDLGINEDDLTEQDHSFIDQEIFRCETCAWWSEVSEMSMEDSVCTECNPEKEEE